ncbi:MAG: DedA family protein [Patescibacteria group bacterium]
MILSQVIQNIASRSLELMANGGYTGVFLLSFLDRFLLSLVPAELILPFAGALVGQERLALWPVIAIVTLGNLIGDVTLYWLSASGGRLLLGKYGRYILVSKHDLDHTDRLFAKHGGKLVIIGRLLPIIRAFVAIPAGVARMPFWRFVGYTAVGSIPFNILLIFAGLESEQNWERIQPWFDKIELFMAGALGLAITWYIYRHIKRRHLTHE